ncbi:unnamed protein product [Peniophora sp. CBMAI 1063]|nr:unnamed protein product [Peniophora sp. CBMAI 1063]
MTTPLLVPDICLRLWMENWYDPNTNVQNTTLIRLDNLPNENVGFIYSLDEASRTRQRNQHLIIPSYSQALDLASTSAYPLEVPSNNFFLVHVFKYEMHTIPTFVRDVYAHKLLHKACNVNSRQAWEEFNNTIRNDAREPVPAIWDITIFAAHARPGCIAERITTNTHNRQYRVLQKLVDLDAEHAVFTASIPGILSASECLEEQFLQAWSLTMKRKHRLLCHTPDSIC